MTSPEPETRVRFIDMLAFVCEVALFVLVIAAVPMLIGGYRSWLIALAAAVAVAVVWGRWIAPSSSRRLDDPERYGLQVVLFVIVGSLVAWGGQPWLGLGFALVSSAVLAATRSDRAI